ncbi:MAG: hypothetical protein AAGF28_09345 [Pseudomonadota bacterium]
MTNRRHNVPLVANVCTYPPRREAMIKMVNRIAPQVDTLNVVLNEYSSVPDELLSISNVNPILPFENMRDVGKFFPRSDDDCYVLLLDDDIIYPTDYAQQTLSRYQKLKAGNSFAGYHGSIYERTLMESLLGAVGMRKSNGNGSLYESRKVYFFKTALKKYVKVDQLGTGVMIAPQRLLPTYEYMRTSQKFCDVRLARWSFEQDIDLVTMPREGNWLNALRFEESIFEDFTKTNPANVAHEISRFAFRRKNLGTIKELGKSHL